MERPKKLLSDPDSHQLLNAEFEQRAEKGEIAYRHQATPLTSSAGGTCK